MTHSYREENISTVDDADSNNADVAASSYLPPSYKVPPKQGKKHWTVSRRNSRRQLREMKYWNGGE